MTQARTVNIADRVIDLHSASGVIVGEKKWTTTQVSGGGGGGYLHKGSGYISNSPVTSRTTTHDQILVRVEDGTEHAVTLSDVNLAVREGHRVSLIWGISRGADQGPYVGIYNHDTRSMNPIENQFRRLIGPRPFALRWIVAYVVLGILCFTPLAAIAAFALFIGLPAFAFIRYRSRAGALRSEIGVVAQGLTAPAAPAPASPAPN